MGGRALLHLRAVDCSYCATQYARQGYGDYHWTYQISRTDLQVKLIESGINAGNILDVNQSLQDCGRAKSFTFSTAQGEIELGSSKLRTLVGPGVIRSSFYRLSNSTTFQQVSRSPPKDPLAEANIRSIIGSYLGDSRDRIIELGGTGSGHGVGLCQWGARALGRNGAHPHPNTEILLPKCLGWALFFPSSLETNSQEVLTLPLPFLRKFHFGIMFFHRTSPLLNPQ